MNSDGKVSTCFQLKTAPHTVLDCCWRRWHETKKKVELSTSTEAKSEAFNFFIKNLFAFLEYLMAKVCSRFFALVAGDELGASPSTLLQLTTVLSSRESILAKTFMSYLDENNKKRTEVNFRERKLFLNKVWRRATEISTKGREKEEVLVWWRSFPSF